MRSRPASSTSVDSIISSPLDITLSPARFLRRILLWPYRLLDSHQSSGLHKSSQRSSLLRSMQLATQMQPENCQVEILAVLFLKRFSALAHHFSSCLVGPGRLVGIRIHYLSHTHPAPLITNMKNLQFTPLILLIDPASSNLSTAALQLVLLTPDRLILRHGYASHVSSQTERPDR